MDYDEILRMSMEHARKKIKNGESDGSIPKFVADSIYELLPKVLSQRDFERLMNVLKESYSFCEDWIRSMTGLFEKLNPNGDRLNSSLDALGVILHLRYLHFGDCSLGKHT